jgi:hypothetical protein
MNCRHVMGRWKCSTSVESIDHASPSGLVEAAPCGASSLAYVGRMKKKALIVLTGLVVLLLGGGFAVQSWIKGRLQKEALVAKMEEAWNCRAHLDDTTVSLFSSPASVNLIGLKLAPRDAEVGKPLAERAALAPEAALITARNVVLSIQLGDLLAGTLNVERLELEALNVRNVVDTEGHSSLGAMFKSPQAPKTPNDPPATVTGTGGSEVPRESKDTAHVQAAKPHKEKGTAADEHSPIKASDLRINLAVKTAGISNGRFESIDLKGGTKSVIDQLKIELTDIDVAPGDLANHNQCKFGLAANVAVEKSDPKSQFADFNLTGSGTVAPFDAKTGEWNPDIDLSLTMLQGGLIGGAPLSKQMGKKDIDRLDEYGVHLGDIAVGGMLKKDATTRVHLLPGGKMIIKQDTSFAFEDYEMLLAEKSWFNPTQDQHSARATLTVSEELSARILEDAKKSLSEKYGETLADIAVAAVKVALMKDDKIVIPFKAKGPMSKPDVSLDNILQDIGDILKSAGKSFLDGLFKDATKQPPKEAPKEPTPEPPK